MAKVVLRSDVAASPDLLWRRIKGFSSVAAWNPLVRAVEAEGDTVGCTREVDIEGAGQFIERLEALDEGERVYRYAIIDSPLPLKNCTVEIRVSDNGDGTATVECKSDFVAQEAGEFKAVKALQQLYQNALDHLQAHFMARR